MPSCAPVPGAPKERISVLEAAASTSTPADRVEGGGGGGGWAAVGAHGLQHELGGRQDDPSGGEDPALGAAAAGGEGSDGVLAARVTKLEGLAEAQWEKHDGHTFLIAQVA